MTVSRRSMLVLAGLTPVVLATRAFAVEALPDARFVGYGQHINDFQIASGRLALAKSGNEMVRNFGARMVDQYTEAASFLAKARAEAGVSFAPDPVVGPRMHGMLRRLSDLEGPDFDFEYGRDQLIVLSEAEQQYGAYSTNGHDGALRKYAEREWPKVRRNLDVSVHLPGAR